MLQNQLMAIKLNQPLQGLSLIVTLSNGYLQKTENSWKLMARVSVASEAINCNEYEV